MIVINNKGHGLIQHLKATANIAHAMAIKLGLSKDIKDQIYTAALLHDIGKAVPSFQIIDDDFQDPIKELYPLHHEISWAFLTQKLGLKYILNAVYWHHARPIHSINKKKETFDTADEILMTIDKKDMDALNGLWKEISPLIPCNTGFPLTGTIEIPDLFEKDGNYNRNDNAEFMLVRACVISADRHVSSLASSAVNILSTDELTALHEIDDMLYGNIQGQPIKPSDYDQQRYDLQVDIVRSIGNALTSIVKAPAGLGKTLIGVLWTKIHGGKTVWVCPRNAVADAVYDNINREIEALGLSCTIELYRTGKRQSPDNGRPEFSSDIIVTNIDTIMSPMVNNRVAGRLFTVFGSNIVLDEFHEFVSDAPLFASFIIYMRARHRVSSSCKTLLLSATPSVINILWDRDDKRTLILPDKENHYSAAHEGTYQIGFAESFPVTSTPGSLLVCNSVSESQKNFKLGYTHIIHHRYTETDRKKIEGNIKESFGKDKLGVSKGESVSAALVIQAAMDISFRNLFDSVCSPESSMQRIERTDRWGTFQKYEPKITFLDIENRTEQGAIRTIYSTDLQSLWIKFLRQELSGISSVKLSELYIIYNKFYQINENSIKKFIIEQYANGMNGPYKGMEFIGLVGFTPIKILNTDSNEKKNKYSNKNLRSPDGSYFYTVEIENQPNKWLDPDSVLSEGYELCDRYYSSNSLMGELLNSGTMLTRLKGLVECGYISWTKQSKGKAAIPNNPKDWFKRARNPETPLPDFSRKYDLKLGVKNLTKES